MVANHKAGLPLATFNAAYGTGAKTHAMGIQALHAANETARSLVGPVAGSMGVPAGEAAA